MQGNPNTLPDGSNAEQCWYISILIVSYKEFSRTHTHTHYANVHQTHRYHMPRLALASITISASSLHSVNRQIHIIPFPCPLLHETHRYPPKAPDMHHRGSRNNLSPAHPIPSTSS